MQPKATKLSTTPIKLPVASVLIQQNQCGDFKEMSRFSQALYMAIDAIFFFCSLTFVSASSFKFTTTLEVQF